MKRTLTLSLALLLAGCGAIEDEIERIKAVIDDSPLNNLIEDIRDGDYRERNDEFIINYPVGSAELVLDDIVGLWEDLEECTGFEVDISHAPLIVSYLAVDDLTDSDFGGFAWLDLGYTEVVIDDLYDTENWVQYNITQNMLLRYMLYQTGSTIGELEGQDIPYSDECLTLAEVDDDE